MLPRLTQDPTEPAFVQNPYPLYDRAREMGRLVWWEAYDMPAAFHHSTVNMVLRDGRFGRECPPEMVQPRPAHQRPFYDVEAHSMLELDGARHKRLRGLVLRAFTSRRIAGLLPEIEALTHKLIDAFPTGPFDSLDRFATPIPVMIIARLLGVPEARWRDLLTWSHAMVAMYQAGRTHLDEVAAAEATIAFSAFLRSHIDKRRRYPADDLITHLIAAHDGDATLTEDELVATCILLLNAGHEATVHAIGNGIAAILRADQPAALMLQPDRIDGTVEEILRYDPPLHMFTRYTKETVELGGHVFHRGDQVALMLGAAGRDPAMWQDPDVFDATRPVTAHVAFGAGVHFCLGAPLARLEMRSVLPILFERCPDLRLAEAPVYSNTYHFHGLTRLMVTR